MMIRRHTKSTSRFNPSVLVLLAVLGSVGLLGTVGCQGEKTETAADAADTVRTDDVSADVEPMDTPAASADTSGTGSNSGQTLKPSQNPVFITSTEGAFQVTFPAGCAKLRRRTSDPETDGEASGGRHVLVTNISCDRHGRKGEGCWVTAMLDIDNSPAGTITAPDVMYQIKLVLGGFGASAMKQTSVSRELPDETVIEGVDILALAPDAVGQVWVRGLLYHNDIYVLVAWNRDGGLWNDGEYQAFFGSFLPYAEP